MTTRRAQRSIDHGGRTDPGDATARIVAWIPCAVAGALVLVAACYSSNGSTQRDEASDDDHGVPADVDARPDVDDTEADAGPEETSVADDGDVGEVDASPCPGEMVHVPTEGFCIDRYEASRGPGDVPLSLRDVMPWNYVSWLEARAACTRAGKRLCEPSEWQHACGGPDATPSPYGEDMQPGYCNERALWDGTEPIPTIDPTGSWPLCEGGYPGLFDMAKNVREWSSGYRDATADTGARATLMGDSAFQDTYRGYTCIADVHDDERVDYGGEDYGFRCCLTP
jgi:hypothetical protein